ncbi:MAG: ABC transporter ATP-binding protein [Leptospiraceae bacterium]|nr:ABC transporter ATP-binding protein [Leptospiraceae bacterium]MCK6381634.1 ABC transporter ATP-binding protein [Leptospiraceae bacterium]NUM41304.1 ABC transporter ATP-binding protein [Leptospiraceae bacterium]
MIKVKSLTKNYIGFSNSLDRIVSALSFGFLGGGVSFQALNSISFEIGKGEIVGVIGRNGAGKSTLLKILTGVSDYHLGEISIVGNVRSILELGVGFNPELSGVENIYYNGIVIGYSSLELLTLIDEIFSFAGVSEFKNVPLKNYSTGMIMRLGFSLATAIRPDILLVDEALAVGDATFQQKCLSRFDEFKKKGTSILIVSHDINLLKSLSDRILVLEKGSLVFDGNSNAAIQKYMQIIAKHSFGNIEKEFDSSEWIKNYSVSIESDGLKNPKILTVGNLVKLNIALKINKNIPDLTIGFHIDDSKNIRAFGINTNHLKGDLTNLEKNSEISVEFEFPINLAPGKYSLGIAFHEGDNHSLHCYLWEDGVFNFEIERTSIPKFDGVSYLPTRLSILKK